MSTKLLTLVVHFAIAIHCAFPQSVTSIAPTPAVEVKKKHAEEEKEKQLRREREIENLVMNARNQPVEIASDLLFGALDARLIKDKHEQRIIIEEIFRGASDAKEPFKLAFYGGNVDTRPGYRQKALELNLDQLSIRLRAIRRMMSIDKRRARQMFREIPDLRFPSQSCDEVLTYAISDYYKLLKEIADQTFDVEARQRKEHIYFAASYIDLIDSPSQVIPVIEFLRSMKTSPAEFSVLLDSLTTGLRKIGSSPRGFALSIESKLTGTFMTLVTRDIKERSTELNLLANAYRRYLAKHLSGTQCADNLLNMHHEVEAANDLFEFPLTEEDIKPEKVDPAPKVFLYWKGTKSAKLLTNMRELRFGNAEKGLSLAERSTQEWQEKLMKFLEQMRDWKAEDEETEIDYLHQKSVLYDSLVDLVPSGVLRSDVLRNYALFLRDSRIQKESPGQWLYYMKRVMKTGKELKGDDLDDFISTLNNSGNSVFGLYIELERLLATPISKRGAIMQ